MIFMKCADGFLRLLKQTSDELSPAVLTWPTWIDLLRPLFSALTAAHPSGYISWSFSVESVMFCVVVIP